MAIKLVFTIQRETFYLEIVEREIFYADRIWKNRIRLIPEDPDFQRKILMSRNRYPKLNIKVWETLFKPTEEEKKEYESAQTEEELAVICIKDVRKKGGVLQKREDGLS